MGTRGYVLKTTLPASDFELLCRSITQKSYFLAQQVDDIKFKNFDPCVSLQDLLEEGRIFNADFEVRYEKLNDGNYDLMVFYKEKDRIQCFNLTGTQAEYEVTEKPDNIFLWGTAKKMKDGWRFIEVRIPRILEYPEVDGLKDKAELVIKACDYKKDEMPCFTKFIGVEIYDSKSE